MADIGHSVLLKYIIDTPEMSEKPDIESNVPQKQEIRDSASASNDEIIEVNEFTYSPVITVTKEETSLTKGDLKLQKVVVSEDISDESTTVNKSISVMESRGRDVVQSEIDTKVHISVRPEQASYNSNKSEEQGNDTEESDHKEPKKTKIPMYRLKETVEKVHKQIAQEKSATREPEFGKKKRSSIPRLKDIKQQNTQEGLNTNGEQQIQDSPKLDDEFDKIYENISTPEKLSDAEIVDSIFDEIIHAYDEKEEPTDKVRSKIPLLKRKSEHEIVVPPYYKNSLKKSYSTDDSKNPVQTKLIAKANTESTSVRKSVKSGSYSLESKSESISAKNVKTFESKTLVTETIKKESNIEMMELSEVSLKEGVKSNTVISKEVGKCKIPVKSYDKNRTETKLNSENLNRFPMRESITTLQKNIPDSSKSLKKTNSEEIQVINTQSTGQEKQTFMESATIVKHILNQNKEIFVTSSKSEHTSSQVTNKKNFETNYCASATRLEKSITDKEAQDFAKNIEISTTSNKLENISTQVSSTKIIERSSNVTDFQSGSLTQKEITCVLREPMEYNSVESNTVALKNVSTQNSEILLTSSKMENTSNLATNTDCVRSSFEVTDTRSNSSISQIENPSVNYVSNVNQYKAQGIPQQTLSTEINNDNINDKESTTTVKETSKIATLECDTALDLKSKIGSIIESNVNKKENLIITDSEIKEKEGTTSITTNENITKMINEGEELTKKNKIEIIQSKENVIEAKEDVTKEREKNNLFKTENKNIPNQVTDHKYKYERNLSKDEPLSNETSGVTLKTNLKILNKATTNSTINQQVPKIQEDMTDNKNATQFKTIQRAISYDYKHENKEQLSKVAENKTILTTSEHHISSEINNNKTTPDQNESKTLAVAAEIKNNTISSQLKNMEELEEEDIIILKGKVSRIISRLDSRESRINKTDDDIPKNVSVVSKIAMFEKPEPIENSKLKPPRQDITVDNKPKIVNELLKTDNLDLNRNIKTKETNISSLETPKSEGNKDEKATDYYTLYNRVHSTVLNRLNSREMRAKLNSETQSKPTEDKSYLEETLPKNITKIDKIDIQRTDCEVFTKKDNISMEFNYQKNIDRRCKSLAEVDLGDAVKGRVRQMVTRMNSIEKINSERKHAFDRKDRTRGSVLSRAALFERKVVPIYAEENVTRSTEKPTAPVQELSDEEIEERITELVNAKVKYGKWEHMGTLELSDGATMPVLAVGTALLEPKLIKHIVSTAIELGYRAIDTAYIYGNEKQIGEAIQAKIHDGTVKREDLFIISKLWSTFHRRDLVETACQQSLKVMGLEYFDLYMIHNPMSFREGSNPLPKIANVLQYSDHDYLEAWYGIEGVIRKGLARRGGVSNFNSLQVDRVVEKGKIKPVINQVECHPYLTQRNLDEFCATRLVKLSCYSVLGSKGTPMELKSGLEPVIDDPLVKVMAAGLGVTPAQLLIAYQIHLGRNVIVKGSTGSHLWDNLQALNVTLDQSHISALNALNKNKRSFIFKGMGDTHRNYPFKIAF